MISLNHIPTQDDLFPVGGIIYSIENTVNNRLYVGASSLGRGRVQGHFRQLRKGIHITQELQNDFNAHGEDSFRINILKIVVHREGGAYLFDKLRKIEYGFIKKFNPFYNKYGKESRTKLIS